MRSKFRGVATCKMATWSIDIRVYRKGIGNRRRILATDASCGVAGARMEVLHFSLQPERLDECLGEVLF